MLFFLNHILRNSCCYALHNLVCKYLTFSYEDLMMMIFIYEGLHRVFVSQGLDFLPFRDLENLKKRCILFIQFVHAEDISRCIFIKKWLSLEEPFSFLCVIVVVSYKNESSVNLSRIVTFVKNSLILFQLLVPFISLGHLLLIFGMLATFNLKQEFQ